MNGRACPGGRCLKGACGGPCHNGKKDGTETDVDCGGTDCPKCDDGKKCTQVSDCASGTCNSCVGGCLPCMSGGACECGSAPLSIGDACYVLLVRAGSVCESASSQVLCAPAPPSFRPRPNDITLVYVKNPPGQSVSVLSNAMAELPTWSARCTAELQTRDDVLAQLTATWGPSTTPDPDF